MERPFSEIEGDYSKHFGVRKLRTFMVVDSASGSNSTVWVLRILSRVNFTILKYKVLLTGTLNLMGTLIGFI